MYKLYRCLGEPHTLRTFLRAVRYPAHWTDIEQPSMIDEEELPFGHNMYVIGDGLNYVAGKLKYFLTFVISQFSRTTEHFYIFLSRLNKT